MSQANIDFQTRILGIGHAMCDISVELEPCAWEAFRARFSWLASESPVHLDAARAHGILSYLEESAAQGQGRVRYAAGGAALNAVRVASLLGARASFVGVVGEDLCGDVVRVGLKASGIEALLDTSGGREGTGIFCTVSRMVGQGAQARGSAARCIFVSPGAAHRVCDRDFAGFERAHFAMIHTEGLLVDRPQNLEIFLRCARDMQVTVSLDTVSAEATRRNRDALEAQIRQYADFVFCNKAEFEALNLSIQNYSPDIVWVIKRDRYGVDCYTRRKTIHVDAPRCAVLDEVGAGDAFAGAFLAAHLAGKPLALCLELGTEAAACALQSQGPEPDARCLGALSRKILAE